MEIIGNNFANIRYNTTIVENVAMVMEISTQLGEYEPQAAASRGRLKVGTMMINRSSHMPIRTVTEEIMAVGIDRSLRMPSSTNGMKKLQTTIVQK